MIKSADESTKTMPSQEEFSAIVQRANAGDQAALAEMRAILDANPEIWHRMGDLSTYARESMLKLISGGDELIRESVRRTADELLGTLTKDTSSPIERLAAERVVACRLESEYVSMLHAVPQGATIAQQKYHLLLKSSAQRRYDQALRSLAILKKLLPPPTKPAFRTSSSVPQKDNTPKPVTQYEPHNRIGVFCGATDEQTTT